MKKDDESDSDDVSDDADQPEDSIRSFQDDKPTKKEILLGHRVGNKTAKRKKKADRALRTLEVRRTLSSTSSLLSRSRLETNEEEEEEERSVRLFCSASSLRRPR